MRDQVSQEERKFRPRDTRRAGEHVTAILIELEQAERKFPKWPDDLIHGVAIVAEEAGEAVKAAMHAYWNYGGATSTQIDDLRIELVQTAAMALSMLEYLEGCPRNPWRIESLPRERGPV